MAFVPADPEENYFNDKSNKLFLEEIMKEMSELHDKMTDRDKELMSKIEYLEKNGVSTERIKSYLAEYGLELTEDDPEKTFTIKDLDLYDIIVENEVIWYMVEGRTKEGVITVKNMVNDLTSIFDENCITEGMTLTKHYKVLKLQKPLLKEEE